MLQEQSRTANWIATAVFVLLIASGLAALLVNRGSLMIEDDARYYTIIAEHIARTGRSTFDGQVLTNGYHPLWMIVLVVMAKTIGLHDIAIAGVEVALVGAGFFLMVSTFRSPALVHRLLFAAWLAGWSILIIGRGMEVSLVFFGFGLLAWTLMACRERGLSPIWAGFAAALTIGARLDAAVFVVPLLLLMLGLRRSLLPFAILAVGGAVYAAVNLWLFGTPVPISGAVKSLGGLQLNERFLKQLLPPAESESMLWTLRTYQRSPAGRMVIVGGLCALALLAGRSRAWPYLWAILIGLALYLGKLLFGSSWYIWPWYIFPAYFGMFALVLALDSRMPQIAGGRLATALAGVMIVLMLGWVLRANGLGKPPMTGFAEINRMVANQLNETLRGAPVAMGDRAGSFAHFYRGPVVQSEGLVNDKAFFEVLKSGGDVKALLCQRGVRYFVAYQTDHGPYEKVSVPLLRPWLTQFPAPALTFHKQDEVARVFDLSIFDASIEDEGDSYLYVWRLSGCPSR